METSNIGKEKPAGTEVIKNSNMYAEAFAQKSKEMKIAIKAREFEKSDSVAIMEYFGPSELEDGSTQQCCEEHCDKKATQFTRLTIGLFKVYLYFCDKCTDRIYHSLYNLPGPDETPEAECVITTQNGYPEWKVLRCPYCCESHSHCEVLAEDPKRGLGHHHAKCGDPFAEINYRGYTLVEKPVEEEEKEPI